MARTKGSTYYTLIFSTETGMQTKTVKGADEMMTAYNDLKGYPEVIVVKGKTVNVETFAADTIKKTA